MQRFAVRIRFCRRKIIIGDNITLKSNLYDMTSKLKSQNHDGAYSFVIACSGRYKILIGVRILALTDFRTNIELKLLMTEITINYKQ